MKENMPLQQAILSAMQARDLRVRDLLARMGPRNRSTVYRLLNGDIRDTRVSTLLALCSALGSTPNEVLGQAGLWSEESRSGDALDLRLRRSFALLQSLAVPLKLVAVTQIERLAETWQAAASGALDEQPSRD